MGSYVPAKGGEETRPNPTERGRPGSKHRLIVDREGVPLAVALRSANVHDSKMFAAMIDAVCPRFNLGEVRLASGRRVAGRRTKHASPIKRPTNPRRARVESRHTRPYAQRREHAFTAKPS
jgi:hypothetical protein